MPNLRVNVAIKQRSPLFDVAKSKAAAKRAIIQVNDAIAQEGVLRIKARLDRVLQNPTGYYRSKVVVDRRQIYRGITDSNVVYGGWLEGVTARNKTTRFKGYWTFQTIRQELARDKSAIAAPIIEQLIKELKG
jgi:hypothetical protein